MKRFFTIPLFVVLCLSFCTNQRQPTTYRDQTLDAHCQVMRSHLEKKLCALEEMKEQSIPRKLTAVKASDAVHQ